MDVHHEEAAYWAEVRELPGCFASGETVAELLSAVQETVPLYLASEASLRYRCVPELVGLLMAVETTD